MAIAARAPVLVGHSDEDRLAYRKRVVALGGRTTTGELAVASAATAAYQRRTDFLTRTSVAGMRPRPLSA